MHSRRSPQSVAIWIGLLISAPASLALSLFVGRELTAWAQAGLNLQVKVNLLLGGPLLLLAMTALLWCLGALAANHPQTRRQ